MTEIKLFGASTIAGQYLKKKYDSYLKDTKLTCFSRSNKSDIYFDLSSSVYPKELFLNEETLIISFSPIWLFVPFLKNYLEQINLKKIKGLIIISSTSVKTKKYSWNDFDKKLYYELSFWEKELIKLTNIHSLKTTIIRPTLIYGDIGYKEDKNLNNIIRLMNFSLFLPIPKETGLRQPIHYSQLSKCTLALSKSYLSENLSEKKELNIFNIGGDEELNFEELLNRIQENFPKNLKLRKCFLIKIPNRLFFFIFSPLIIFSPKYYAALLRISINMVGFEPSYKIHGENKNKFPVNARIKQ